MPLIDLNSFPGLGVIVRWPSGVLYTNQVAGFACEHPEVEGVFVPLFDDVGRPSFHALHGHFRGSWHPLTGKDADVIDGILRRNDLGFMVTDRSRLEESREAWVCVRMNDDNSSALCARVRGFGVREAILTWPNSD